jgi:hypothetical protein
MATRGQFPLELTNAFLAAAGLRGITDTTSFTKDHISLAVAEALLPDLEPFYTPQKANVYIYPPLTQARVITLIRHILRTHGLSLASSEHSIGGAKKMYYRIINTRGGTLIFD